MSAFEPRRGAARPLLLAGALCALLGHPAPARGQQAPPPTAVAGPGSDGDHRLLGWSAVGGGYAVMGAYAFYSWYDSEDPRGFYFRDEGWFGRDTYAGGADKVGHLYASYVIARAGSDLLAWSGVPRDRALAASLALDALFFTAIEIKDGCTDQLGFSWGDIAANLGGELLAVAFARSPSLDRALDLRLEYYPSREYLDAVRSEGSVNAVEDYTGMTFGLWCHLGEIPGVRGRPALSWLRFLDVGVTYGSRYYRPRPDEPRAPERELAAALGLNFAEVARALAGGRAPAFVRTTDQIFEYFTVPGTSLGTH